MKVLQLSNKIPNPERDGGAIAINAITEGLLKVGCEVKMLAMNTKKHFMEMSSIPEKFRKERQLETVAIDTSVKPLPALIALLTGKSYNVSRFQSENFSKKLSEILQKEQFDIIHLEGIYMASYLPVIRQHSKAAVILRAHNIEWRIWEKLAMEEKNMLKKWYLGKLSKQLRKHEEKMLNFFDGIATITSQEMEYLKASGCKVPIVYVPFGLDVAKYTPKKSRYPDTLSYMGALDWLPNLQGLDWFFKNVWGEVYSKFPNTQFHIAGRNMPDSFYKNNHPGVVLHGEVENAKIFIEEYDIMLVPLLAGSGVRVKIIEGMAMGKAIITTTVGIEGIACTFGRDVLVADTPEEFGEAVCRCFIDKEMKKKLEYNARKFVEENYDIGRTAEQLVSFYNERILQMQA